MAKKCFVLIKDGKVVQKQPNKQKGFIEAHFDVVFGYLYDSKTGKFSAPPPQEKTSKEIRAGIRLEAAQRISSSGHDWMVARQVTAAIEVPVNVVEYAAAVRAASNILEISLPKDYLDENHWPELLS